MNVQKTNSYPIENENYIEFRIRACSPVQPETPIEAMEFLSRSWSLSAAEISRALAHNNDKNKAESPQHVPVPVERVRGRRGKWFNNHKGSGMRKKDNERAEKAETHAALSVAALATGLASIIPTATATATNDLRMSSALASATQLLATHCSDLARSAGADVISVLQSATNVQTPTDLITLTAAAATALRGEATLKGRCPKEAKKNATVIPYENGMETCMLTETTKFGHHDMLQQVHKGGLRWKQVSVYINKMSQVAIKLKSNHVGGAFSTKNKGVVYGVCNEKASWPFCKERENADAYFGVKTAKGLLEFKCKNKIHKLKWVDTIQYLLKTTNNIETITHSINMLTA